MRAMIDLLHNDRTLLAGRPVYRSVFAPAIDALWRMIATPVRTFFARELVLRELAMLGDRDLRDIDGHRPARLRHAVAHHLRGACWRYPRIYSLSANVLIFLKVDGWEFAPDMSKSSAKVALVGTGGSISAVGRHSLDLFEYIEA